MRAVLCHAVGKLAIASALHDLTATVDNIRSPKLETLAACTMSGMCAWARSRDVNACCCLFTCTIVNWRHRYVTPFSIAYLIFSIAVGYFKLWAMVNGLIGGKKSKTWKVCVCVKSVQHRLPWVTLRFVPLRGMRIQDNGAETPLDL